MHEDRGNISEYLKVNARKRKITETENFPIMKNSRKWLNIYFPGYLPRNNLNKTHFEQRNHLYFFFTTYDGKSMFRVSETYFQFLFLASSL